MDEAERQFWARVDMRGPLKCWHWTGAVNATGYGFAPRRKAGTRLAHRIAWYYANGDFPPIPDGQRCWVVMHKCDHPSCVNPAHLQLGTFADNSRDMSEKGRWGVRDLPVGSAHGNAKLTEEQVTAIRQSALSNGELAEQYGVTKGTIEYARKYGWKHVKVRAKKHVSGKSLATRGANNPISRLTDDDVRAIRASTEKPGALAKRFGVVPDYVTMIRKRKVWKHVT